MISTLNIAIFAFDLIIFVSIGRYLTNLSSNHEFEIVYLSQYIATDPLIIITSVLLLSFMLKLLNTWFVGKLTFEFRAILYKYFLKNIINVTRSNVELVTKNEKFSYLTNIAEFLAHNVFMSLLNLITASSYIILVLIYILKNLAITNYLTFLCFFMVATLIAFILSFKSNALKDLVVHILKIEAAFSNKVITGSKEIIHYNAEDLAYKEGGSIASLVSSVKFRSYWLSVIFRPILEFLGVSLLIALIWFDKENLETNLTSLMFLIRSLPHFQSIVAFIISYKLSEAPIAQALDLFDREKAKKQIAMLPSQAFSVENVTIVRGANKITHNNMIFEIGKHYALTGASATGKSTLLEIFSGYQVPTSGYILVDGHVIHDAYLDVDYVFQEPLIFNGTVEDNVALFEHEAGINRAAKVGKILSWLDLNLSPDDIVHDFGSNLSGGQRARISLARALYRGGDILFLDECFSQIQKHLAIQILNRLGKEYSTIILISHDHSIIPSEYIKIENVGRSG